VKDELGMCSRVPHTAVDFILGGLIRALQSPKMTTPQVDKGLSVLFVFIHGARAPSVARFARELGFGRHRSAGP
jgi:hypothetical protein